VVDRRVWETAVPDTTVTPDERPAEVDSMLSDVPQPPGFDAEPLRRAKTSMDRYQLGARVVSAVGCAWTDRWSEARRAGDRAAEQQAVGALGTSRTWRILTDMDFEGDFPEGVWQAAEDMASGTAPNRWMSVEDGVRNKLGC
jgi:hypothetical protein